MTTPLATIADALIEFILSLLRDPAAAAQFAAEPEETLAEAGLSGAQRRRALSCRCRLTGLTSCSGFRPLTPVHPGYSPQVSIQQPQSSAHPPTVVEEITNVTTNFAIDARTTIIDNRWSNIWGRW